jgi:hypothetical protein
MTRRSCSRFSTLSRETKTCEHSSRIKLRNTTPIIFGQACMTSISRLICSLTIIGFPIPPERTIWLSPWSGAHWQWTSRNKEFRQLMKCKWRTISIGNAVLEAYPFLLLIPGKYKHMKDLRRVSAIRLLWLLPKRIKVCNRKRNLKYWPSSIKLVE